MAVAVSLFVSSAPGPEDPTSPEDPASSTCGTGTSTVCSTMRSRSFSSCSARTLQMASHPTARRPLYPYQHNGHQQPPPKWHGSINVGARQALSLSLSHTHSRSHFHLILFFVLFSSCSPLSLHFFLSWSVLDMDATSEKRRGVVVAKACVCCDQNTHTHPEHQHTTPQTYTRHTHHNTRHHHFSHVVFVLK